LAQKDYQSAKSIAESIIKKDSSNELAQYVIREFNQSSTN